MEAGGGGGGGIASEQCNFDIRPFVQASNTSQLKHPKQAFLRRGAEVIREMLEHCRTRENCITTTQSPARLKARPTPNLLSDFFSFFFISRARLARRVSS